MLQADYIDTSTVETRLQNVARRMVSTTPRRAESERPASSGPQQNGYPPADNGGPAFGASTFARSYNGGQLHAPNLPGEHSLPAGSTGVPHASTAGMGMPGMPPSQFMQHGGVPMHASGALGGSRMLPSDGGDSPGMGPMLGVGQMKVDSPGGGGGMSMGSMGGYPLTPAQPSFMRGQGNTPGSGPVMSNGAPVLLRSSRDWVPGQSPSVLNVRLLLCALGSLPFHAWYTHLRAGDNSGSCPARRSCASHCRALTNPLHLCAADFFCSGRAATAIKDNH